VKLVAYPKYRPSGIEWVGDVPEHWTPQEVKFCYEIQLGKMLQPEAGSRQDIETPYLKSQHVQWNGVRVSDLPTMWASKADLKKYAVVDGDLLVCEGGDVGRASVVRRPPEGTIIQNALHRVRPRRQNDCRFLSYVLEHAASQGWFEILCNKATIAHFTGDKFGMLETALPPAREQRAIADFLDRETARLDTLVGKKGELIEKLKEKRTALISRTVTRGLPAEAAAKAGLNPLPKLKPSGIEWLGDIPEHWAVKAVRRIATRIQTGSTPPTAEEKYYEEGTVPWFGPGSFGESITLSMPVKLLNIVAVKDGTARLFRQGATMIVTIGATLGKVSSIAEDASCNQQITVIEVEKSVVHPRFLTYQLKRLEPTLRAIAPSATLPILSQDEIARLFLALPSEDEQRAIGDYLDGETGKMDKMMEKVEAAIEKLQEYRTALITAAVTGKIDVRTVKP
jgi:type I restriction enzyme S subunit